MARPLLSSHHLLSLPYFSTTTNIFLFLAAVAAVASVILSLCTTHKHSKHKYTNKNNKPPPPPSTAAERKLVATLSGIGSKALVVAKMVSWKRGGAEDGEDSEEEEVVWRKSILMGEKCRPLDFSGQILYDSEGNEVKKKAVLHHHDPARLQVELNGDCSGPNGK